MKIPLKKSISKNAEELKVHAFSLIELLVVTGVIAILAGMLMPALTKARAKAVEANMVNSTRQMHLALLMYFDEDENNQFVWNILNGGKISVDFTELEVNGFRPKMMEDPFRTVLISEDPFLTVEAPTLNIDAAAFYGPETGLLYFNFISKHTDGTDILTLQQFNDKFGYDLPDDTQYAVVGVGMNGHLDPDRPIDDFVYIKREGNSNNERWPTK